MGRAWKRLDSVLRQRDVALLLPVLVIGFVHEVLFEGPSASGARLPVIALLGFLELLPLLVLVRFARRRAAAGRALSSGQLLLGIGSCAVIGAAVVTFPGPYEILGVAVQSIGSLVRAALVVGALELHA